VENAGASLLLEFWGRRGDIASSGTLIRAKDIAIFCKHEVAGTIDVCDSIRIHRPVEGNRIFPGAVHRGDGGWRCVVNFVLFFFQMADELTRERDDKTYRPL